MTTAERLVAEMLRVFADEVYLIETYPRDGCATVTVNGWPEPKTYHVMQALAVLKDYSDAAGATEIGDAIVCADLEQQGAMLSDRAETVLIVRQQALQGESEDN